jgi:hypothetical protein
MELLPSPQLPLALASLVDQLPPLAQLHWRLPVPQLVPTPTLMLPLTFTVASLLLPMGQQVAVEL